MWSWGLNTIIVLARPCYFGPLPPFCNVLERFVFTDIFSAKISIFEVEKTRMKNTKNLRKILSGDPHCEDLDPHEILARAARGYGFITRRLIITYYKSGPREGQEKSRRWVEQEYYPTLEQRLEAAKAAAPYYKAKATGKSGEGAGNEDSAPLGVMMVPTLSLEEWQEISEQQQKMLKQDAKKD